jgi:hypothetical protein
MSLLEGLASTLAEMGSVQLALVFLAVGTYSMAINGAFGSGARSGAASTSFVAAIGFAALTPSWISGVVLLAVAVLAVAAFAASAWAIATLLGLGSERGAVVVDAVALEADERSAPIRVPMPQALRAFAASFIRSPL